MKRYDVSTAPDPKAWLELDEQCASTRSSTITAREGAVWTGSHRREPGRRGATRPRHSSMAKIL